MNVQFAQRAIEQFAAAPPPVQRAFLKQINYLVRDLGHPSLHAKKYLESESLWQARVNQDWRFYFKTGDGCYYVTALVPHPK
jgi:plasmid maintenance system killer protein